MKGALLISSLTCICLVSLVQCFGGIENDQLSEFLKARSFKGSDEFAVHEDLEEGNSSVYVGSQEGLKEADKITTLVGQPNGTNFDQYSGYVTVDPKAGRALFYYFAESQNPSTKPLVLWQNGGPGCSSLGAGALTELGPFRVNKDGKTLWHNEYAWNIAANILFLESPAGVGFSYSNTSSDYQTGDTRTAKDLHTFLINWFERFPEYKTRDFFMVAEGYGSNYVLQVAQLILHNNKITNQTFINLKGIAIGNPFLDTETQAQGLLDFFWAHSLLSDEIHQAIVSNCNFSVGATVSDACQKYWQQATHLVNNIYPYDIYEPWCTSKTVPSTTGFDPCSSDYVNSYLNIPEVQTMLHANITGLRGPWGRCNMSINSNWKDSPYTVLPTIKNLMASGITLWIYSGDTDGNIPVTTTKYAIKKLGISIKTPWHPWFYTHWEVGGYVQRYENLTFVTVRGAGHFVPSYQPARALVFFTSFLKGEFPPTA